MKKETLPHQGWICETHWCSKKWSMFQQISDSEQAIVNAELMRIRYTSLKDAAAAAVKRVEAVIAEVEKEALDAERAAKEAIFIVEELRRKLW